MANDVSFEHRDYTQDGMRAEQEFCDAVLKINPDAVIKHSTEKQDMFEHWDFDIDGVTFDVKARRNMGMLNSVKTGGDRYTVLELKNRNGDKGWLFGDADYICFELVTDILNVFLIVPRLELVKYHYANTKDEIVYDMNECVNKRYRTIVTKFELTGVSLEEISKLPKTKIIRK